MCAGDCATAPGGSLRVHGGSQQGSGVLSTVAINIPATTTLNTTTTATTTTVSPPTTTATPVKGSRIICSVADSPKFVSRIFQFF